MRGHACLLAGVFAPTPTLAHSMYLVQNHTHNHTAHSHAHMHTHTDTRTHAHTHTQLHYSTLILMGAKRRGSSSLAVAAMGRRETVLDKTRDERVLVIAVLNPCPGLKPKP